MKTSQLIVGFGFNQNGYYDIWSGSFTNSINKYKDHDVILMWELGNEYNYHPEWFGSLEGWYHALTNAAGFVHKIDPSHPVATAHGELLGHNRTKILAAYVYSLSQQ